jgi:hypothetical protein
MDYVVDLDPTHRVLRITVTAALTDEACRDIYRAVARLASQGGPYHAAITDLSRVEDFSVSAETIRALAATGPMIHGEGPRVIVAPQTAAYGLARMFELYRDSKGGKLQTVVRSMDEAYELLKVSPEDFTQRLLPERMAA